MESNMNRRRCIYVGVVRRAGAAEQNHGKPAEEIGAVEMCEVGHRMFSRLSVGNTKLIPHPGNQRLINYSHKAEFCQISESDKEINSHINYYSIFMILIIINRMSLTRKALGSGYLFWGTYSSTCLGTCMCLD